MLTMWYLWIVAFNQHPLMVFFPLSVGHTLTGGVDQSPFPPADLGGANCTLKELPWSFQMMMQKAREAISTSNRLPQQSRQPHLLGSQHPYQCDFPSMGLEEKDLIGHQIALWPQTCLRRNCHITRTHIAGHP